MRSWGVGGPAARKERGRTGGGEGRRGQRSGVGGQGRKQEAESLKKTEKSVEKKTEIGLTRFERMDMMLD